MGHKDSMKGPLGGPGNSEGCSIPWLFICALNPKTPNPALNPKPQPLNPRALNPKPQPLNPRALNPEPQPLKCRGLNPKPQPLNPKAL